MHFYRYTVLIMLLMFCIVILGTGCDALEGDGKAKPSINSEELVLGYNALPDGSFIYWAEDWFIIIEPVNGFITEVKSIDDIPTLVLFAAQDNPSIIIATVGVVTWI